ncbi:MAG: UPF0149 family protein [Opitutae bacterium]|nr:UPF0149 family protein [Opitutae bacterium]
MTRYEAAVEKGWEEMGLAHVLISRFREDGSADFAMFLVDVFCLGVKDAVFETNLTAAELRTYVEQRLPEDYTERLHPACAKKLIEGALAYAESLGFAPHRDYRNARKILSGLDASVCPRDFTYGRDGRPCYVRGSEDTEERVNRVCTVLAARCGADGYDYEDPSGDDPDDGDDALAVRDDLIEWLAAEPDAVPRFYEVSGLVTAMLLCPTVQSPLKILDVLWGPRGRTWRDAGEVHKFSAMLMAYWNHVGDLVHTATAPGAAADEQILDVWEEDFEEEDGGLAMAAATFAWATGFLRATEYWPDAWAAARARRDLAPHWEVLGWWATFNLKASRDQIVAHAEAAPPRTLNAAVVALARALRPAGPDAR